MLQAAVHERKAFPVKNTVKWIGLLPCARASLCKTLLLPFLLMDIVIQKKKLINCVTKSIPYTSGS